jgi:DcmR-like sensory protein
MSRMPAAHDRFHAVRFYEDAETLSRIVGSFLAEGFQASQPAVVIATPVHRAAIESRLAERSLDVNRLVAEGALHMLDADEVLAEFMVDGMPDAGRFHRAIVPVIQKACGGRKECIVRAYGEMVDVLWKADQTVAATRLETLWNVLANNHAFSLLCGYAMGSVYKNAAVEEICSHHSHVISTGGDPVAIH